MKTTTIKRKCKRQGQVHTIEYEPNTKGKAAFVTQLAEYHTFNVGVKGSNPFGRTKNASVTQLVRVLHF